MKERRQWPLTLSRIARQPFSILCQQILDLVVILSLLTGKRSLFLGSATGPARNNLFSL